MTNSLREFDFGNSKLFSQRSSLNKFDDLHILSVGNLSSSVRARNLFNIFSLYGYIESIAVLKKKNLALVFF